MPIKPNMADPWEELKVRLISAVLANVVTDPPAAKIDINLSLAMEMVDKVLLEHEVKRIKPA